MNSGIIVAGAVVAVIVAALVLFQVSNTEEPTIFPLNPQVCGNEVCNVGETPETCPDDCIPSDGSVALELDDSEATLEGTQKVIDANNLFAMDIYAKLKQNDGNLFFSPYSISSALAMTYEGARGPTASEIKSVFHLPEDILIQRSSFASVFNRLNKPDKNFSLHTANALWAQENYKFLEDYVNTIANYYGGGITNLDFAGNPEQSRLTINDWVEGKTSGKIKDLFPQGAIDDDTMLVLTNTIYFKGNWAIQFDKTLTKKEDFKVSPDSTVQVDMMRNTDEEARFNYAETSDLQILEMLYENEDLSMLVLLPKNDDMQSLEDSLTLENINEWKGMLTNKHVEVFIPKFTFTSKYELNGNLIDLGMPSAFNPGSADFSGLDGSKNLYISLVIHQAFVDVNEEGTEAAAATGVSIGSPESVPPPRSVFRADHPFIFVIQERETGNILFFGKVNNPGE